MGEKPDGFILQWMVQLKKKNKKSYTIPKKLSHIIEVTKKNMKNCWVESLFCFFYVWLWENYILWFMSGTTCIYYPSVCYCCYMFLSLFFIFFLEEKP